MDTLNIAYLVGIFATKKSREMIARGIHLVQKKNVLVFFKTEIITKYFIANRKE